MVYASFVYTAEEENKECENSDPYRLLYEHKVYILSPVEEYV